MGRRKRFIDKDNSDHFHVVHRSQQDKAAEWDSKASEFVLVPSGPAGNAQVERGGRRRGASVGGEGFEEGVDVEEREDWERYKRTGALKTYRDHVSPLGMPNDGYDYSQHFKAGGGGTFVSSDGKVRHAGGPGGGGRGGGRGGAAAAGPGGAVASIPEEALGSTELLDRQLEAVTISSAVMDADMRRAMGAGVWEGRDDEEEEDMEELEDDFVLQAAGDGDDQGDFFDYDAHIARLMAASERDLGLSRPRTKDDDMHVKLPGATLPARDRRGGGDEDSDDSGEFDQSLLADLKLEDGGGASGGRDGGQISTERELIEAQFEAALAEYDSDEWGELDEDDDRVQGKLQLAENEYAARCLDEFLEEDKDAEWAQGIQRRPQNGEGEGGAAGGGGGGGVPSEQAASAALAPVGSGSGGLYGQGVRLGTLPGLGATTQGTPVRREGKEEEEEEDEEKELPPLEETWDYLKPKEVEKWDCETVVSTYSNLDNHPSLLKMPSSGRGGSRRRRPASADEGTGGEPGPGQGQGKPGQGPAPTIQLSRKTGLPVGVLPSRTGVRGDGDGSEAERGGGGEAGAQQVNLGVARDKKESKEEKRERKNRMKEEKKAKREQKKSTKEAFSREAKVASKLLANPEASFSRSVFSYA